MKKDQSKKKHLIYLIVGVLILLLVVVGATYAFFQSQIDKDASIDATISTGTTDVLTFTADEEGINIKASESNFNQTSGNLSDETFVTATLKANNTTNKANDSYNVYLIIDKNNLIYTKGTDTPELIMEVTTPEEEVITLESKLKLEGLRYHTANTGAEPNDVSGFDITNRIDTYAIAENYPIEVTGDDNGEKVQTWKVKVTLINLNGDQNKNTGKELNGRILITKAKEEAYQLPHIDTIADTEVTNNSITITLNKDKGNKKIDKYYYGIEEIGPVMTASIEDVDMVPWDENTYTFNGLNENTNYKIYAYAIDEFGFKSNEYETQTNIATDKLPSITGVEVEKTYHSLKVKVTGEQPGTNTINKYEYHITGGVEEGQIDRSSGLISEKEYLFDGLSELIQYQITVIAYDSKGLASAVYTIAPSETTTLAYKVPTISVSTVKNANSITFNVSAENGDGTVAAYWYKFNNESDYTKVSSTQLSDSKTYNSLAEKTQYPISIKVIDNNNRESIEYKDTVTTDTKPTIYSISTGTVAYNKVTFNITATKGTHDIKNYTCTLKQNSVNVSGITNPLVVSPSSSNNLEGTCEFLNLNEQVNYTVEVIATDTNNNSSAIKTMSVTTPPRPYHETCTDSSAVCQIAKKSVSDSTIYYHDGRPDNEEETNYMYEAGDYAYRYTGLDPDNYVCLDTKDSGTCAAADVYRIIGIFKNEDEKSAEFGKYEMKLIKSTAAGTTEIGTDNYSYSNKYKWGTQSTVWQYSELNTSNLNSFYYNYITKKISGLASKLVNHVWYSSLNGSDGLTVKEIFDGESGKNRNKVGDMACYPPGGTLQQCTLNDVEYHDEIGLIYRTDFAYASSQNQWSQNALGSFMMYTQNNWMYNSEISDWTISPEGSTSIYLAAYGSINSVDELNSGLGNVRPTFYLISTTTFKTSGNGKINTPYRIA